MKCFQELLVTVVCTVQYTGYIFLMNNSLGKCVPINVLNQEAWAHGAAVKHFQNEVLGTLNSLCCTHCLAEKVTYRNAYSMAGM